MGESVMLYISRSLGVGKWAVTDTDDGVEEAVTSSKLQEALKSGIEIKGAELVRRRSSHGVSSRGVPSTYVKVSIYVPPEELSPKSVKAFALKGLNIPVRNGEILGVGFKFGAIGVNQRIRLSDYGDRCANFIFTTAVGISVPVVIVFDDKVAVKRYTFRNVFKFSSILIDISEVTKDSVAKYLYDEYYVEYRGNVTGVGRHIIDNKRRAKLFECIGAVYHDETRNYVPMREDVLAVAKFFEKNFKRICSINFELKDELSHTTHAKIYFSKLKFNEEFWRARSGSFDEVFSMGDNHLVTNLAFVRDHIKCNYIVW